jgi:hypothetical protein
LIEIGDMIAELIEAGCDPIVAATVGARLYAVGINSAEFRGAPVDKTAEKRRAYDRERKRKSTGNPPESTGNPKAPSIPLEKEEKKEKKERGSQISEGWKPDDVRWEAACRVFGKDGALCELEKFTAHHKSKGTVFKNWNAGWDKWVLNAKQWAPKQVAGVGVVNPDSVNWRAALQSYKNFGNWPKGHGNDPTSPACRAPPELLREFGLELRRMA